ncbi:MAG: hypothetical protein LBS01_00360 [Prevotellaceae bacterium]|nr:hypothetical protein [Prevotellaceae bacterium]
MKVIKSLALAALAVCIFTSCKEKEPEQPPVVEDNVYAGKVTVVAYGQSQESDLEVKALSTAKEDSIVLFLQRVQFVPQMPGLDIKIPVQAATTADYVALSGTGITPYLVSATGDDTPYPTFSIDNVSGKITSDSLIFSTDIVVVDGGLGFPVGLTFPTSFAGKLKK